MSLTLENPAAVEPSGELSRKVGERIRRYRKVKELTLQEVAEHCGTTPQTIQRLETGNMSVTVHWIERVCLALEIPPYALFSDGALQAQAELNTLRQAFRSFCSIVEESCREQL